MAVRDPLDVVVSYYERKLVPCHEIGTVSAPLERLLFVSFCAYVVTGSDGLPTLAFREERRQGCHVGVEGSGVPMHGVQAWEALGLYLMHLSVLIGFLWSSAHRWVDWLEPFPRMHLLRGLFVQWQVCSKSMFVMRLYYSGLTLNREDHPRYGAGSWRKYTSYIACTARRWPGQINRVQVAGVSENNLYNKLSPHYYMHWIHSLT